MDGGLTHPPIVDPALIGSVGGGMRFLSSSSGATIVSLIVSEGLVVLGFGSTELAPKCKVFLTKSRT